MDKNAIKKFAVWARRELISRVSQKAAFYGITEKDCGDVQAESINGKLLSATEKKQRQALIGRIQAKGYEEVMEEVAYTWFNRFSALRFMEVNGYLPSHVRVFTDDENRFQPQILAEAINLDFEGLDMDKVYELKDTNATEELYKYLLIVQCNELNAILPKMFQKIGDYTELLFPENLLRESSVIEQMITLIPEEDWQDQVQIIGWLYQYYNSEKKDEVFAALKKNVKITKENIPAATQLFTPDWIVRYMVENSLGRLWVEGHPNDELKSQWKYYLEEAEQEPEVQAQLSEIRKEYTKMNPEDIKCIDPCCGSGHILAYMFDVLVQIYEAYGYTSREAVVCIVENNIYGLDIDERAAQLANFAVMMKARQYDRRFFSRGIQPKVYAIVESNEIDSFTLDYFVNGNVKLKIAIDSIIKDMYDAKEYGSILNITPVNFTDLYARIEEVQNDININRDMVLNKVLPIIQISEILVQKYDAVVTNPPYMGANNIAGKLSDFIKNNYPQSKSDLSTVFMEKCLEFSSINGYIAMINIPVWMFLTSFEELRKSLVIEKQFINLLHLGRGVFGADFGTTAFVIRKNHIARYVSNFRKLYERQGSVDDNKKKIALLHEGFGQCYRQQDRFFNVPGICIAYNASDSLLNAFVEGKRFDSFSDPKQGLATADNNRFLRLWFEVEREKTAFSCGSHEEASDNHKKWFPYNKGGGFKKWYGNNEYLINWENDGLELINFKKSVIRSPQYYFKECLSWCKVTISGFSMRYIPQGFLFDVAGCSLFLPEDKIYYVLGFANSKVNATILSIISPTVNYEVGHIASLPLLNSDKCGIIENLVQDNIRISMEDWDDLEVSWDYKRNLLVRLADYWLERIDIDNKILEFCGTLSNSKGTLEKCYLIGERLCNERFEKLKRNEESINQMFIDIYRMENELTSDVEEKDITVRKADLQRDIKELISYAVGCMFGRYSLDVEGLAYAGGEWDVSKYTTFVADKDNIIPICDDEYFEDDIVGRFVDFVRTVYGSESLEENLRFVADALGGKGQPKEVIRNYFLNDFYKDHCKMYQKRPIYWLFDSGKKNGFKALIYMHRYLPDTIARIRTDYVHEQQSRYRTAIEDLEQRVQSASTSERVKLNKNLKIMKEQALEIQGYEEKIHHLADQFISIDLDDGVKVNYAKFQDVLAKIK